MSESIGFIKIKKKNKDLEAWKLLPSGIDIPRSSRSILFDQ